MRKSFFEKTYCLQLRREQYEPIRQREGQHVLGVVLETEDLKTSDDD
jgi:hypothetical protein